MIANTVDNRKRQYRWKSVLAIVEPVWHDNSCEDSDQANETGSDLLCDERDEISVSEAVRWANKIDIPVTLYLRDTGDN